MRKPEWLQQILRYTPTEVQPAKKTAYLLLRRTAVIFPSDGEVLTVPSTEEQIAMPSRPPVAG